MIARNVTGIFQIVFLRVLIGAHFSHQFQDLVFNCLKEKRKSIRIFCQFNRIHQASLVALRGHIRIPNWKWILKSLRWSCLIFLFISLANSFFFLLLISSTISRDAVLCRFHTLLAHAITQGQKKNLPLKTKKNGKRRIFERTRLWQLTVIVRNLAFA